MAFFFDNSRFGLPIPKFLHTSCHEDCLTLAMLPTENAIPDFRSSHPCLGEHNLIPNTPFSPGELNLSNELSRHVGPEEQMQIIKTEKVSKISLSLSFSSQVPYISVISHNAFDYSTAPQPIIDSIWAVCGRFIPILYSKGWPGAFEEIPKTYRIWGLLLEHSDNKQYNR